MDWIPKTRLGQMVLNGEITTMSDALATKLPLREAGLLRGQRGGHHHRDRRDQGNRHQGTRRKGSSREVAPYFGHRKRHRVRCEIW